ncbi:casein kinase 2 regulatory subunit [Apophysomyces sp. BC1015]|nr:casein kinase 2 regulatory subunit [Apophysomyces sp. BC1015]
MTSLCQQDEICSSSSSSTNNSEQNWIAQFCSWSGHEYYVEVPEDYIDDQFNMTGLSAIVPHYDQALEMILDMEPVSYQEEQYSVQTPLVEEEESSDDDGFWKERPKPRTCVSDPLVIGGSAVLLYGLIHQRYLLTSQGQRIMAESPENPKLDLVDGAHFGSTYLHLLFMSYPQLVPAPKCHIYQPRIFGFRVNEVSSTGPRMQWLRRRPLEYLDNDSDSNEEDDAHSEEDDDLVVYDEMVGQPVPSQAEDINQIEDLATQTEGWRIRDSGLNQFFRRFL